MKRRAVIAVTLTLAVAAAATMTKGWIAAARSDPDYRTDVVSAEPLELTVSASGTVEPQGSIEIGTELSGRIQQVNVRPNDRVRTGDILVVMDPEQLESRYRESEATLDTARARVAEADANLLEAEARFARVTRLVGMGFVSAQELDTARASQERAKAGVLIAKAQVKAAVQQLGEARTNLRRATIRSPLNGVVIARNVEPGQTVAAAFQTPFLLKLAQPLTMMELRVLINEADLSGVREGQEVTFTVDAFPEKVFHTTLASLHNTPKSIQGAVVYEAVMNAPNEQLQLRPGMTATGRIKTGVLTNVLSIPNAALRFIPPGRELDDGTYRESGPRSAVVWTLRDGQLGLVRVQTGESDGKRTVISPGPLSQGDLIATGVDKPL
jgi:HlyD family secretion protein